MSLIFDSHAHYDDPAFDRDRDELLESLFEKNVCAIVNVGANLKTSQSSIELAEKYPSIWAAVGVHPQDAESLTSDYIEILRAMLKHKKVVAIGEIGLDYHYDGFNKKVQQQVFEDQLKLAKERSIPVIVHSREAGADTLTLLKKYKPKGVVHCFSGSCEMADEVIRLGMYIGLGGVVTFKNAKNPVLVAKNVPIERLLVETDCPYMAPVPMRGQRCDSSMIQYTAEKIAQIRNMNFNDLLSVTKANASNLFSISI